MKYSIERNADYLIGLQSHPRQTNSHRRSEPEILVDRPQHGGKLLDQYSKPRFAFASPLFRAFSLDGKCDLPADRREKIQIPLRVRIAIFIMLQNQYADRFVGRSQWNADPGRRGSAHELQFTARGKFIEDRLA